MSPLRALTCLLTLPLLAGCANYNFDLQQPAKSAATVTKNSELSVPLDPMEYHFQTAEGQLVVRIKNPTTDPIQLLGDRSSAVDARGEAHPLRGQTVPPGAFVKVIIPPPRPTAYDSGPTFGFGFGMIGHAGRFGGFHDSLLLDTPRTYTLYDEGNNAFWDWKGGTTARMIFTFERAGRTFSDEFVFLKRKV